MRTAARTPLADGWLLMASLFLDNSLRCSSGHKSSTSSQVVGLTFIISTAVSARVCFVGWNKGAVN